MIFSLFGSLFPSTLSCSRKDYPLYPYNNSITLHLNASPYQETITLLPYVECLGDGTTSYCWFWEKGMDDVPAPNGDYLVDAVTLSYLYISGFSSAPAIWIVYMDFPSFIVEDCPNPHIGVGGVYLGSTSFSSVNGTYSQYICDGVNYLNNSKWCYQDPVSGDWSAKYDGAPHSVTISGASMQRADDHYEYIWISKLGRRSTDGKMFGAYTPKDILFAGNYYDQPTGYSSGKYWTPSRSSALGTFSVKGTLENEEDRGGLYKFRPSLATSETGPGIPAKGILQVLTCSEDTPGNRLRGVTQVLSDSTVELKYQTPYTRQYTVNGVTRHKGNQWRTLYFSTREDHITEQVDHAVFHQ